jgi:hypothetical protein
VLRYGLVFPVAVAAGLGSAACGPSFQATYECDVRFEHCYALDETVASPSVKQQCWHDWLAGYTFGQPRDRVEFAASRVKTLSAPPGPLEDDPPPVHAVAAPLPTNAFAPPPPVISSEATAVGSSQPSPATVTVPRTPGAECAQACERRWASCHDGCRGPTCERCDRAYRVCMPACFR